MLEAENHTSRCRECIAGLNQAEGWGLSGERIEGYVEQIAQQVPDTSLDSRLEAIVRHYHADHELFFALRDEQHREHPAAWAWTAREISRVAQYRGLSWSRDPAVETVDLVQTVQAEVVRSLPDYRFESSLKTWLQSITVRRLCRFHRDTSAAKRGAGCEPLDVADTYAVEWSAFEHEVLAGALFDEITRVLEQAGDKRYATIFRLRVIDEQTAEAIGKNIKLHPSRVRALLKMVRDLLQNDAALRNWNQDAKDAEGVSDVCRSEEQQGDERCAVTRYKS